MSKFITRKKITVQLKAGFTTIVEGTVVNTPSVIFVLEKGITDTSDKNWLAKYNVTEKAVDARIRGDQTFGTEDGITEFTEEDQDAVKIKSRKMKEADEEIKEKKRVRRSKK